MTMKHDILAEATRILAVSFGSPVALEGGDPLKGTLNWLNHKRTQGEDVFVGYVLGTYNPTTEIFNCAGFTVDGVDFVWGSVAISQAPAQEASKSDIITSYALNVHEPTTFDVFTFIATSAGALNGYGVDWGSGNRFIGLKWADFQALSRLAIEVYQDVITVSPQAPYAKINSLSVVKG
jgi:hypothetical protein